MKAVDYIAGVLAAKGVKHVFGIPGGASIPYMEAFAREGIEFILTSGETAAGVMADVTGRLTGIPGICHSTFGPGATNLATGVGGSLLDRSPVIAFTSEVADTMRNRTCQMNVDHQALFQPLTKKTARMTPVNAAAVLEDAFDTAISEYPGPVHIGLPSDLAEQDIGETDIPGEAQPDRPLAFDGEQLEEKLARASRPLLAIGLTARRLGIISEIRKFLAGHPMPTVLTPMAKGLISRAHPCYTGVLFHALSAKLSPVLENTDLVISLGYDPVEYNYESWMPEVPLVSVNTVPVDMPEGVNVSQITGDLRDGLRVVSGLLGETAGDFLPQAAGIRKEMNEEFASRLSGFGPVAALEVLKRELPADAMVTTDVGSHLHLAGQFWDPVRPEQLIMTNGWSSMGFGLPAALAVQLNNPGKPVACITGDGGLLMTLGELITARRYNLPVIIVTFADRELNLIKLKQSWKNADYIGTGLYEGDLFQEESILGVRILKAENTDQFKIALEQALACPGPIIVEAVIDPSAYAKLIQES